MSINSNVNLFVNATKNNPTFYCSKIKNKHIDNVSCGGQLELRHFNIENDLQKISYKDLHDGALIFHKIFIHNNNTIPESSISIFNYNNNFELYYIIDNKNTIEELLAGNNINLKGSFVVNKRLIEDSYIKINKPLICYEDNIPTLWNTILQNKIFSFFSIGEQINIFKHIPKLYSNFNVKTQLLDTAVVLNVEDYDSYWEITIDKNINYLKKYNNIIIANKQKIFTKEITIKNFSVNSNNFNYSIDNYPIETNPVSTFSEDIQIYFTSNNSCDVKFLNNNFLIQSLTINNDLIVENIGINGLQFKMNRNGFIGNIQAGNRINFTIDAIDEPLWLICYIPKRSYNLFNQREKITIYFE